MKFFLSPKTLQNNSGFGRSISKINDISFINNIKGITSRISWINEIYSASDILKVIYVCNLLHHNTRHPAYVIIYPVRNMAFYSLPASD